MDITKIIKIIVYTRKLLYQMTYTTRAVKRLLGDHFWEREDVICFYTSRRITKLGNPWDEYNLDRYAPFSNFHPVAIPGKLVARVFGLPYVPDMPTTEHYFQAFKFIYRAGSDRRYREYVEYFALADSPNKTFALGNQKKQMWGKAPIQKGHSKSVNDIIEEYKDLRIDPDWNTKRVDVMHNLVMLKFCVDPGLRRLLLSTGDKHIVEFTSRDSYWGSGGDHTGSNLLGQILVQIRKYLKDNLENE